MFYEGLADALADPQRHRTKERHDTHANLVALRRNRPVVYMATPSCSPLYPSEQTPLPCCPSAVATTADLMAPRYFHRQRTDTPAPDHRAPKQCPTVGPTTNQLDHEANSRFHNHAQQEARYKPQLLPH